MIAAFPPRARGAGGSRGALWTAIAAASLLGVWLHAAWVSEDAHITLRALENLLSGNGLRWNPDERVQVFTHPLWLFSLAPLYAASGHALWSFTLLGLACSLAAYAVLVRALGTTPLVVAGLTLPWLLSGCLTRYATSGFENPLTQLLIAIQAAQLLSLRAGQALPWGRLCLVAALAATNRLDTLALHGPPLVALALFSRQPVAWGRAAAGALPLVAWLAFSLTYFGFLMPNTAHAKLAPGVPLASQLARGLAYAEDLVTRDLESALLLVAGWAAAIGFGVGARRGRDPAALGFAGLGAGSFAYCCVVVGAGGDFLAGRHFSPPVFASLCCVAAALAAQRGRIEAWPAARRRGAVMAAALGLALVFAAGSALRAHGEARVLERSAAHFALTLDGWEPTPRAEQFAATGRRVQQRASRTGAKLAVLPILGVATREIDPELILVDPYALADPLLARLPPSDPAGFKPGHAEREIPTGYLEARATGDTSQMDPALAEYYTHLRLVVAGPLFDAARWRSIAGFHTGAYAPLLERYNARVAAGAR